MTFSCCLTATRYEAALEKITRQRAILYDPAVVDACVRLFAEKKFTF
jgi:hypothetical protein